MLRIHAIIIALNEEDFIAETLKPLYAHCSGLSVITQYDRDYYRNAVSPDSTVEKVLNFPDPEAKIHLVVRRYIDETTSRNHEMLSLLTHPERGVMPHAWDMEKVRRFHEPPDYFLVVDADEMYDVDTFPAILEHLELNRPRAMSMLAYDHVGSWRFRVPPDRWLFKAVGFVRAGQMFTSRRVITWNEHRVNKLFAFLKLGSHWGSRLCGCIECPREVGVFHHGGYVRSSREKLIEKMAKHSHRGEYMDEAWLRKAFHQDFEKLPLECLPRNIREGKWPTSFMDDNLDHLITLLLSGDSSAD